MCFTTAKYNQDVGTVVVPVGGLITGIGEDEVIEAIQKILTELADS